MKKLNILYIPLVLCFFALLLYSCEFINCIDGNGFITTESRIVSEFSAVENTTSYDVDVIADSVFSVEVTGDENLLYFINTYVRHGNLIVEVDYNRCINPSSYMLIEVHMPALEMVELTGSGDIDVYGFNSNYLEIKNSGSGDIDLMDIYSPNTIDIVVSGSGDVSISGKARRGDYLLTGSGDIVADDLKVDECYITTTGSGNIYCYVYDLLNVTISGSGDVYYSGSPEIHLVNTGSGDLRERN